MGLTTYTIEQIQKRHAERVAALVDLFGDTMSIPQDIIRRLQDKNKQDHIQHIAERDGKGTEAPAAELIPAATPEQVGAVEKAATSLAEMDELFKANPAITNARIVDEPDFHGAPADEVADGLCVGECKTEPKFDHPIRITQAKEATS